LTLSQRHADPRAGEYTLRIHTRFMLSWLNALISAAVLPVTAPEDPRPTPDVSAGGISFFMIKSASIFPRQNDLVRKMYCVTGVVCQRPSGIKPGGPIAPRQAC
jgi:hypothetical protein